MAQIYDLQAIREQTRAVMQEPRRLDWRTPPSLKQTLDWYRAYGERHEKPLGVGGEHRKHDPAVRASLSEAVPSFPEDAA